MRVRGWQRREGHTMKHQELVTNSKGSTNQMTSRTEWMKPWISRGEMSQWGFKRWNGFTSSTPSNVGLRGHFSWLYSKMIMKWNHLEELFGKHPLKYDTHACSFCLYALWVPFSCRSFFSRKHIIDALLDVVTSWFQSLIEMSSVTIKLSL